jgi:hypothetical protein
MKNYKLLAIGIGILVVVIMAVLALLPKPDPVVAKYDCGDGVEVEVVVTGNQASVTVPGGVVMDLKQVSTNNSLRFESDNGQDLFWVIDGEAVVKSGGDTISKSCLAKRNQFSNNLNIDSWERFYSEVFLVGYGFSFLQPPKTNVTQSENGVTITDQSSNKSLRIEINLLEEAATAQNLTPDAEGEVDSISILGRDGFNYLKANTDSTLITVINLDDSTAMKITYDNLLPSPDKERAINLIQSIEPYRELPTVTKLEPVAQVKLALLSPADSEPDRGCDNVELIERNILPTTQPLNESIRQLFAIDNNKLGELNHFIPNTNDTLSFDRATIIDGEAQIYLLGKLSGIAGVCDEPRAQIQIEETALQFEAVDRVQLFLNGAAVSDLSSEVGAEG